MSDPDPSGPANVVAPDTFRDVAAGAAEHTQDGGTFEIDLGDCAYATHRAALPLGSAWVLVHPTGDHCELWLGGETENPRYDGSPSQYCLFDRHGAVMIALTSGGPPHLEYAWCVSP